MLDEAEQKIFNISDESLRANNGFQDINSLLKESVLRIEDLSEKDEAITGVATGFTNFDKEAPTCQIFLFGALSTFYNFFPIYRI